MRRLILLLVGLVAAGACGDDDGNTPTTGGTIEITTATIGEPGTDYTVIVDGASPRTIAANATLSIPDVDPGSHIVQLTLPTGCTLEGDNPRTISVTQGAITTIAFAVTCG